MVLLLSVWTARVSSVLFASLMVFYLAGLLSGFFVVWVGLVVIDGLLCIFVFGVSLFSVGFGAVFWPALMAEKTCPMM